MRKSKKKPLFPQKGKIILVLKNGTVIQGGGMIDGTKNTSLDYQFSATLIIKNDEKGK